MIPTAKNETTPTELIPRSILFGNPERAAVRISPDGTRLAFLAPLDGVMNIWIAPIDDPQSATAVTHDKGRGIRSYFWTYNNEQIVYVQDKDGDENWRVYALDVASQEVKDLTPLDGVRARIQEVSADFPNEILVGLNDRDPQLFDIYRVNLRTGERQLLEQNEQGFTGYVTDDEYNLRLASKFNPDGTITYFENANGTWKDFVNVPADDTMNTYPAGFDASGKTLYWVESRGRNTSALTTMDMKTGKTTLLAEDPKADLNDLITQPKTDKVQAVSFDYERRHFVFLDDSIRPDFDALQKMMKGELIVTSRTHDDSKWIAASLRDDGPVEYYLWDRATQKAKYLFTNQPALEGLPLSHMKPVIIKSRDGLDLVSYLTIPKGLAVKDNGMPAEPQPMVLLVHGGPWARDSWGYDSQAQLLANRGYAVLSVNYRGSTGFGKDFTNAGDREWAAKMHNDLLDAVDWAVQRGIADKNKVAIMGGSYGGYATLVGLTFTPDVFACGVDIVGPSNLVTLLESVPPYWKPMLEMFRKRVGDMSTDEGRAFLESRSPLNRVDNIVKPLLIAQGANDPRVKQAEADQIVHAMEARNIPVTYVLYPDEGHGFARPENRISFMAITEAFLAEHLGGRYEPIGSAFTGSSVTVPVGATEVPGLEAAVAAEK